jgi:hypothetical protein
MAARIKGKSPETPRRPPGTTPEARENQLILAAVDAAEKQILAGTASSQVITHYLKLGSTRERLEQERLRNENDLLRVKVEQLAEQKNMGELYEKALNAMKSYSGQEVVDEDVFD